jgi:hypothetical protein
MSQRNGDKSRFQINRKRTVLRRAKIRALVAAGSVGAADGPAKATKRPAHAKLTQKA